MKPDISAVLTACRGCALCTKTQKAAQQACIAYAIQIVEGMACYDDDVCDDGQDCIEHEDDPADYCDRCTTLAKLREEQKQ